MLEHFTYIENGVNKLLTYAVLLGLLTSCSTFATPAGRSTEIYTPSQDTVGKLAIPLDLTLFSVGLRACFETAIPNGSCDDITDVGIPDMQFQIEYRDKTPALLKTNEQGISQDIRQVKNGGVPAQIITPPPELSLVMPDGSRVKTCRKLHVTRWQTYRHYDFAYSKDACDTK